MRMRSGRNSPPHGLRQIHEVVRSGMCVRLCVDEYLCSVFGVEAKVFDQVHTTRERVRVFPSLRKHTSTRLDANDTLLGRGA